MSTQSIANAMFCVEVNVEINLFSCEHFVGARFFLWLMNVSLRTEFVRICADQCNDACKAGGIFFAGGSGRDVSRSLTNQFLPLHSRKCGGRPCLSVI